MAQKKFSELEAGTVDGTSIFAQTKTESGSLVSKSASATSLAGYIGTSHQFAGLSTTAKNLVGAINEAASMGGVVQLTQAEYTALTSAEKMNGSIYKITDNAKMYCLDEEYHPVKELTTAQYEALTSAEKNNGTIYIKTDAETTGSDIPVSDTDATSIADKIDELADYSYDSKTCLISLGTGSSLTLNVQCYGKLVIASFTGYMTNSATVSAGDILFDGLPKIRDFSEVFYITSRGRFRIYNDGNEGKVRIYDLQSVNAYIGFTLSYISS